MTDISASNTQIPAQPSVSDSVHDSTQDTAKTPDAPRLFSDFDLPKSLLTSLDSIGFTQPTDVQEQTLQSALAGNDLMVSAQTGSGKTVAFLLPCLAHVINTLPPSHSRHKKSRPKVLIICPTRELVQQVTQDAINLVKHTRGVRIASVMGGMSYGKQIANLKGAQVVIATPGRLLDLSQRNNIQLHDVSHMVLDEADRMLDLGFSEDLASISTLCEQRQQTLLFSATFADEIVGLAKKLMEEPERIALANTQDKHSDISQALYWADDADHKQALLMHWLANEPINQAVIFTPTKVETEKLALNLRKAGYSVVDLHGGMRQYIRMKQIKKLRDGKAKILVATDVAARGLDVPSISHVINYGIPMKNEDYVHRIGRTGRAGRKGYAITVAMHSDRRKVFALQKFLAQDIDVLEVAGLEPTPYQPRNKKRPNRRRGKPRPCKDERDRKKSAGNHNKGGYGKAAHSKSGSSNKPPRKDRSGRDDGSDNRRHKSENSKRKPYKKRNPKKSDYNTQAK